MKKFLSLLLAALMLVTAALPIFATEQDEGAVPPPDTGETPKSYEDLYGPGAIYAWNAYGAKEGDALPEGGVLPSSTGDDTLKVSVLANATDATVAYGDRHVVLIGGMYETESIFALPELGATNTYSYQIVTMPLDENIPEQTIL